MFVDIFGVPWDRLERADVEGFLSSASGEGLIWEGKAGDPLPKLHLKIRHGVCGLANQLGGVFIVGADQRVDRTWHLPGVPRGGLKEDPHDWLCRVITGGLANPPRFEVKCWQDGDQVTAAIRVERIAVPPCLTKDGLVFQRVVGETLRVRDPGILRALIRGGEVAREEAEAKALGALPKWNDQSLAGPWTARRIDIALVPVLGDSNIEPRLYSAAFKERLLNVFNGFGLSPHQPQMPPIAGQQREGYVAWRGYVPDAGAADIEGMKWSILARWDGVFIGSFACHRESPNRYQPEDIIFLLWDGIAGLARFLIGSGDAERAPAHIALTITDGVFRIGTDALSDGGRPVQRWVTLARPDHGGDLYDILAELRRGGGAEVFG